MREGKNSDPGWKKVGSGIGRNIPDQQHCQIPHSFGVQDLQVSAAAVGCGMSLPELQVQGPGPHQLGQARHVHRLQHHSPGAQGIECIL